jgi:hypothetical protein
MVPVSSHFLCKCISAYLVGSDELIQMIEDGLTHTSTLSYCLTGCFLFIFREQCALLLVLTEDCKAYY